jgi:dephospho-CoA kinase
MLIGLTGGIGSGKSTVARRWVELGATEIDADVLARAVVEPGTAGLQQLIAEFGNEILLESGALDRKKLGTIIFENEAARLKVESILHPLIQDLAASSVAGLQGVIIYTIPLLVETTSKLRFDKIVTISASESTRIKRLVESRGMTPEQAKSRIQAQASDFERETVADLVIDSDCSMQELLERTDAVFESLTT